MNTNEIIISKLSSASGKECGMNKLILGEYQYIDRQYQFNYIPKELNGCMHIKTHGNDKLIGENDICLSFEVNCDIDILILYADKFPLLPNWLDQYERTRLNVTRQDSRADNLKGYFGLYRKTFEKGLVKLFGCSPNKMLAEDWYKESGGANYCMYTVAILEKN
jgi:hypothetical protein